MDFYAKGLARMNDRWAGTGVTGLSFMDLNHPYAADLDLFGEGSLFERLCTARTRAGEEALASWLLAPAPLEMLAKRHEAVTELRPRLDLREDLELLGSDVRSGIDPEALAAWGRAPRAFPGNSLRITAALLAALGSIAVIGWAFFDTSVFALLGGLAIEIAFAFWLAGRVRHVLEAVDERAHDLVLLGDLLDRLEREPASSILLRQLSASLEPHGRPASVQIRRLARLLHLLDARKNQLFFPVAAVLLWKTQIAMAVDAWRGAEGPAIAGWLSAVGEFEALCALAAYAAENPADPFPEFVSSGACFEAHELGHPLIPAADCVRNDLSLGVSVRALVVSGSNMSGKSTLLRRPAWQPSWPWPGRRCGPPGSAFHRLRWGRPCVCKTPSRPGNRGSTPRSPGSASSSIWPAARCRSSSFLMNCSMAPIHTIAVSEPSRCCRLAQARGDRPDHHP